MALFRVGNGNVTLSQYGTVAAAGTHTFSKGSIVVMNGATLGSFGTGEATLLQHIQGGARDDMDIYEILVDNATYTAASVPSNYAEISV